MEDLSGLVQRIIDEAEQEGWEIACYSIWQEIQERVRQKGREEGLEKGREETVLDFLKAGVSAEVVAKATSLSPERVQELADSLKKQ